MGLVGLVGATLGVVTVAAKGLGGKMFAVGGWMAGLAALPIALGLFLLDLHEQQRLDQQSQTLKAVEP
ncbi:hypothetical protein [Nonomuraea sp. KM90]|uniref:hypothetical protein n=1 Tax=Nonomuraea sp. KM90 TaxID=3457428 RepID=UPI003FCD9BC9